MSQTHCVYLFELFYSWIDYLGRILFALDQIKSDVMCVGVATMFPCTNKTMFIFIHSNDKRTMWDNMRKTEQKDRAILIVTK